MSFTKNILLMIASPADAWESIKKYNVPISIMLSKVLYPMLALLSITAFTELFYHAEATVAYCIQRAIIDFAKFFFGYHICSYMLTGFWRSVVTDKDMANRVNTVLAYNLVVLIILNIINNLLPTPWLFINIFYLYIFLTTSKASDYLGLTDNQMFLYIIAAFSIVVPFFIGYLLNISLSFTAA